MGYIYLIGESDNCNNFKIGVTRNEKIINRKDHLQTGNSNELYVNKIFKSEFPFKLENMLHRHYNDKKIINEWFKLNDDDLSDFLNICEKYENILLSLKNNPFFNK